MYIYVFSQYTFISLEDSSIRKFAQTDPQGFLRQIACSLLQIKSIGTLQVSPFLGNLFENLIISDFIKQFYNGGQRPSLYFWRDKNDIIEIDGLVDIGKTLVPIEIKASETISTSFFNAMIKWNELSHTLTKNNYIIYGGTTNQKRSKGNVLGWKSAATLMDKFYKK